MQIRHQDFNNAAALLAQQYAAEWEEIEQVLRAMPLHLKASDQAGIQGSAIFSPVGTNKHIKDELHALGWHANIPIPAEFNFLGTDIDLGKGGVIVEAQFSNYPFLLNNLMWSELFFKTGMPLGGEATGLLVVITKAHMFPASQSTLYYEQAVRQVDALANNSVFDTPIRVVGLFEDIPSIVDAAWTEYHTPRYSRTVVASEDVRCEIRSGATSRSRARLTVVRQSSP